MRVLDFQINNAVHLHADVVFGDADLCGDIDDLFFEAEDIRGPINKRDEDVKTGFEGAVKLAEALDNKGAPLRNDDRAFNQRNDDKDGEGDESNECWSHNRISLGL